MSACGALHQPPSRVGDQATGVDDGLPGRGQGLDGEGQARGLVEQLLAFEDQLMPFLGLNRGADHDPEAEVDGVLEKDPRDAPGHHHQAVPVDGAGRLLATGAAAEVLIPQDDAAGRELLGLEAGIELRAVRETERGCLSGQHRGHVAAGIDVVRADIGAELDDDLGHVTSLPCADP